MRTHFATVFRPLRTIKTRYILNSILDPRNAIYRFGFLYIHMRWWKSSRLACKVPIFKSARVWVVYMCTYINIDILSSQQQLPLDIELRSWLQLSLVSFTCWFCNAKIPSTNNLIRILCSIENIIANMWTNYWHRHIHSLIRTHRCREICGTVWHMSSMVWG